LGCGSSTGLQPRVNDLIAMRTQLIRINKTILVAKSGVFRNPA
jgi:hypothetical protein